MNLQPRRRQAPRWQAEVTCSQLASRETYSPYSSQATRDRAHPQTEFPGAPIPASSPPSTMNLHNSELQIYKQCDSIKGLRAVPEGRKQRAASQGFHGGATWKDGRPVATFTSTVPKEHAPADDATFSGHFCVGPTLSQKHLLCDPPSILLACVSVYRSLVLDGSG